MHKWQHSHLAVASSIVDYRLKPLFLHYTWDICRWICARENLVEKETVAVHCECNLSLPPSTKEWFTVLENYHRLNATVSDLIMGNSYSFRVFSQNRVGSSESCALTKDVAVIQKTGDLLDSSSNSTWGQLVQTLGEFCGSRCNRIHKNLMCCNLSVSVCVRACVCTCVRVCVCKMTLTSDIWQWPGHIIAILASTQLQVMHISRGPNSKCLCIESHDFHVNNDSEVRQGNKSNYFFS